MKTSPIVADPPRPRLSRWVKFVSSTYLFFLYFSITPSFINLNIAYIFNITFGILLALLYPNIFFRLIKSKTFFYPLLFLSFFLIISILWPIAHGTNDYSFVAFSIGLINSYIGSAILVTIFLRKAPVLDFAEMFFYIFLLQSIFIILMLLVPSIREFIFNYFTSGRDLFERSGFRGLGVAGAVAYSLSMALAFGMLFSVYIYFSDRSRFIHFLGFCTMGFSLLLVARSGFIVFPFILFLIAFSIFRTRFRLSAYAINKLIIFIFYFIFFILLLFAYLYYSSSNLAVFIMRFSFELFINFIDHGDLKTSSTDVMMTMYFIPSQETLIYGDAKYLSGEGYYKGVDIGYLRHILYFGLIPPLLLYGFFISIFYKTYKRVSDPKLLVVFSSFFISSFVIHAKGTFLNSLYFSVFLFVFYFYFAYAKNKIRVE